MYNINDDQISALSLLFFLSSLLSIHEVTPNPTILKILLIDRLQYCSKIDFLNLVLAVSAALLRQSRLLYFVISVEEAKKDFGKGVRHLYYSTHKISL